MLVEDFHHRRPRVDAADRRGDDDQLQQHEHGDLHPGREPRRAVRDEPVRRHPSAELRDAEREVHDDTRAAARPRRGRATGVARERVVAERHDRGERREHAEIQIARRQRRDRDVAEQLRAPMLVRRGIAIQRRVQPRRDRGDRERRDLNALGERIAAHPEHDADREHRQHAHADRERPRAPRLDRAQRELGRDHRRRRGIHAVAGAVEHRRNRVARHARLSYFVAGRRRRD